MSEPVLIPEQCHQLLGLLAHIHTLIAPVPVHVLKVTQRLDGEGILAALLRHALRARLSQVVEQGQGLNREATVDDTW